MVEKMKNVGLDVEAPKNVCSDDNCPFHGSLRVRGRTFVGVVISAKMHKTVIVEWSTSHFIPKFERSENRLSKVKAHNPDCIAAVEGDKVKIAECRPLSKTKNFVVIQKLGREKLFTERMEARQESKVKEKEEKVVEEE
jgi:small subunit ribosomal protein S17